MSDDPKPWTQWRLVRFNRNIRSHFVMAEFHLQADALAALDAQRRKLVRSGETVHDLTDESFRTEQNIDYRLERSKL